MKRRFLLLGGASAAVLATNPVLADDFFHWRKPGGDPYRGTLEGALNAFSDLLLQDPDVQAELREKVQRGQGTPSQVFAGWQVTRMMFSTNRREPNVIVDASDLAAWGSASRKMVMYTARRQTGSEARTYAIFRPEVCGNWCIQIMQRVCVLDTLLCDQGCRKRRSDQYKA